MSVKNLDRHNRWRNVSVSFRVSPEEDQLLETLVKITGLSKQEYILRHLFQTEVVVEGNLKVFHAMREELEKVLTELQRIEAGAGVDEELLTVIELITDILYGLGEKEEE